MRNETVPSSNKFDLAQKVSSPVVIIHAGTIEIENDPTDQLRQLYAQGRTNDPEFQKMRQQLLTGRDKAKGPYVDAVVKSLQDVIAYARGKIIIGLETRYYPVEMPNFEEIGILLKLFDANKLQYWHDVGHAEVNERLGIRPHEDFLKNYSNRMMGVHIHGVDGLKDHAAPFTGNFDLMKVTPFLNEKTIKVIESRFASFEELKIAVEKLSSLS